jgi:hypothetical protein
MDLFRNCNSREVRSAPAGIALKRHRRLRQQVDCYKRLESPNGLRSIGFPLGFPGGNPSFQGFRSFIIVTNSPNYGLHQPVQALVPRVV